MKGSPQDPMTQEELSAKFSACLRVGLPAAPAGAGDRLLAAVGGLERQPDAARALVDAFPR
jgi:hypothetical protein